MPRSQRPLRLVLAGVAATAVAAGAVITATGALADVEFPANQKFDYQIGAAYPTGAKVVSRDVYEKPAGSSFDICYINAFQTQPGGADVKGSSAWFFANAPELLLPNPTPDVPTLPGNDESLQFYFDPHWEEVFFDLTTQTKRAALAKIIGEQITKCGEDGGEGAEFDNLDSYTRAFADLDDRLASIEDEEFDGTGKPTLISENDALAFARLLVAETRAAGLKAGQKNAVELGSKGRKAGFEFAVIEQCGAHISQEYDECAEVAKAYGNQWVDIEYSTAGFQAACRSVGSRVSVVLRDRDVTAPGSSTYVYQEC